MLLNNRTGKIMGVIAAALMLTTSPAAAQAPLPDARPAEPAAPAQTAPNPPRDRGAEQQMPSPAIGSNSGATAAPTIIPHRDNSAILAKELIGNDAVTKDGVKVGTVQDLILDQGGRITGIVISTGGFLGIGGKTVGVSTQAVDIRTAREQEAVFVNMNANEIKSAPPLWKKATENPISQRSRE